MVQQLYRAIRGRAGTSLRPVPKTTSAKPLRHWRYRHESTLLLLGASREVSHPVEQDSTNTVGIRDESPTYYLGHRVLPRARRASFGSQPSSRWKTTPARRWSAPACFSNVQIGLVSRQQRGTCTHVAVGQSTTTLYIRFARLKMTNLEQKHCDECSSSSLRTTAPLLHGATGHKQPQREPVVRQGAVALVQKYRWLPRRLAVLFRQQWQLSLSAITAAQQ